MAFSILYWTNFVSGTRKLSLRSELAVKSDHILKFIYDPEMRHVQGRVQASMRDRSYHVNITLGDNYTTAYSMCDCVNGKDKCHHKASLLLYGYKNVSKTDIRATWIQHPKSLPPKQRQTMEELFPAPPKLANYSNALDCLQRARCPKTGCSMYRGFATDTRVYECSR
ncbi:uncharacterized protein LOC117319499 [Pecten maximus]|uniref:uncharacterized protein LOC117319499 n=1 Tax=Pecten maximus TaxID=6579 RepID=UPI0014587188|nr:uncharacterized protein LOC117319499 [Pecten maximus]